ncbi:MAG: tRNA (N(6)-L-threonylcarbamoyladenosine(37)-C(2))-methylthiotransferase MtaB [Firmicutes bacterium]|nr:tRNA (N(6)-L-threonylcarbamoyladenosine(37)-C(2))-methylthiotransferase MtaB [Bacillota bacterium]
MKVAFHTLGCKVNQYETEAMREQFAQAGHVVVGETDVADVYIINTCTVTSLADRKSRQYIRRMKKQSPDSVVAVTGCYVQIKPDEVAAIEGVDIIAGTDEKENLIKYITEYIGSRMDEHREEDAERHVLPYEELTEYHGSGIITSMESRTRAYIKIEDGCDRFCSYCVIPYARGKVRSRPKDEILEEAKSLVGRGFKEIILTGINTALYEDLPGLLEELDKLTVYEEAQDGGNASDENRNALDFRVRLSSLEPTVVDAEYVKGLFKFRRLCHHLHLSLQSGSDNVLSAMKRRYDMKDYMEIVKVLRDFDPLYGISTDIIAGFPGETDEDIAGSVKAIEDICFCKTHAFNYSQRPGTVAAEMDGQVPPPLRKERVGMLLTAGDEAQKKFAELNIGTINTVLFEEFVDAGEEQMMAGYTDNYIRAYAPYQENLIGQLVQVKVEGLYKDGVLVETE